MAAKRKPLNRLLKARMRMGYSQRKAMRAFKFKSHSRISQWEKGKRNPSLYNAMKLARLYKTHVGYLFPDIDEQIVSELEVWQKKEDRKRIEPP